MDFLQIFGGLLGLFVALIAYYFDAKIGSGGRWFRSPVVLLLRVAGLAGLITFYSGLFNGVTGRSSDEFYGPIMIPAIASVFALSWYFEKRVQRQ